MIVKVAYKIIAVTQDHDIIYIIFERPDLDVKQGRDPLHVIRSQNDDERVAKEVAQHVMSVIPMFGPPPPRRYELPFTVDEYEKLGRPTVGDLFGADIDVQKTGEPAPETTQQ